MVSLKVLFFFFFWLFVFCIDYCSNNTYLHDNNGACLTHMLHQLWKEQQEPLRSCCSEASFEADRMAILIVMQDYLCKMVPVQQLCLYLPQSLEVWIWRAERGEDGEWGRGEGERFSPSWAFSIMSFFSSLLP